MIQYCRIDGSCRYTAVFLNHHMTKNVFRFEREEKTNVSKQLRYFVSLFCRTFFMYLLCFGSCNVAPLCDNLIIENYGSRCFARYCAETSVFAFRFDFARMGGTLWSPHTKATFWNSLRILRIGCGKLNSCGMSFSMYHRYLTQR